MSEDETAKLWKVNRTIHELVKDRVRGHDVSRVGACLTSHGEGIPSLGRRNQHGPDDIQGTLRKQWRKRRVGHFLCASVHLQKLTRMVQSKPTQFLHQLQRKSNGPNLYILFGGEKGRCKHHAQVRLCIPLLPVHLITGDHTGF